MQKNYISAAMNARQVLYMLFFREEGPPRRLDHLNLYTLQGHDIIYQAKVLCNAMGILEETMTSLKLTKWRWKINYTVNVVYILCEI